MSECNDPAAGTARDTPLQQADRHVRAMRLMFGLDASPAAIEAARRFPQATGPTLRLINGIRLAPAERRTVEAKHATYRAKSSTATTDLVPASIWAGAYFDWKAAPAGEWVLHFTDDPDRWLHHVRTNSGYPYPERLRARPAEYSLKQLADARDRFLREVETRQPTDVMEKGRIETHLNRFTVRLIEDDAVAPSWLVALGPEIQVLPARIARRGPLRAWPRGEAPDRGSK